MIRKLLPLILLVGTVFCQLLFTGELIASSCARASQAVDFHLPDVVEELKDAAVPSRATLRNPLKDFHLSRPVETVSPVSFAVVLSYAIALNTFSKQSPCYGLLFLQHLF